MALTMRSATSRPAVNRTAQTAGRPAVRGLTRRLIVRASAEPTPTGNPTNEYLEKAQSAATEAWTWVNAKWSATEDSEKPAVIAILAGVVIAQIAIGATIDVVDRIPVVNTLLQLVGLAVTSVFIFKLTTDAEERDAVKSSVAGFLDKVTGDK